MAFVVKYRGLDVSIDSLDQLDQLADRLSSNGAKRSGPGPNQAHGSAPNQSANPDQEHAAIRKMMLELSDKQRLLLIELGMNDKRTDKMLRETLDLESNKALAGVLAGISKALKRHGIRTAVIMKASFRSSGGDREYTYSLNPAVQEDFEEVFSR
jgi:hypothetical protein